MPKKPTPNPVHESITHLEVMAGSRRLNCRVWRTEEPFQMANLPELSEAAYGISRLLNNETKLQEAIECVSKVFGGMDRVSAVEVIPQGMKSGTVFYSDWS